MRFGRSAAACVTHACSLPLPCDTDCTYDDANAHEEVLGEWKCDLNNKNTHQNDTRVALPQLLCCTMGALMEFLVTLLQCVLLPFAGVLGLVLHLLTSLLDRTCNGTLRVA